MSWFPPVFQGGFGTNDAPSRPQGQVPTPASTVATEALQENEAIREGWEGSSSAQASSVQLPSLHAQAGREQEFQLSVKDLRTFSAQGPQQQQDQSLLVKHSRAFVSKALDATAARKDSHFVLQAQAVEQHRKAAPSVSQGPQHCPQATAFTTPIAGRVSAAQGPQQQLPLHAFNSPADGQAQLPLALHNTGASAAHGPLYCPSATAFTTPIADRVLAAQGPQQQLPLHAFTSPADGQAQHPSALRNTGALAAQGPQYRPPATTFTTPIAGRVMAAQRSRQHPLPPCAFTSPAASQLQHPLALHSTGALAIQGLQHRPPSTALTTPIAGRHQLQCGDGRSYLQQPHEAAVEAPLEDCQTPESNARSTPTAPPRTTSRKKNKKAFGDVRIGIGKRGKE